jgi:hypothetical protein
MVLGDPVGPTAAQISGGTEDREEWRRALDGQEAELLCVGWGV